MPDLKPKPQGKILAIDYGKKFIGLAVSDPSRIMAFGRGTLAHTTFEEIAGKISKLCLEEGIREILIGLPLPLDGLDTAQTLAIRKFAENLQQYFIDLQLKDAQWQGKKLIFNFIDEAFTSFEARQFLSEMGVKKSQQKITLDELAAIFILRRYIDFS